MKIVAVIGLLVFLNLFDWIMTMHGLRLGVIYEANPISGWFLEHHPHIVLGIKLVCASMLVLAFRSTFKWIRVSPYIVLGIYVGVAILHIHWLAQAWLAEVPGILTF